MIIFSGTSSFAQNSEGGPGGAGNSDKLDVKKPRRVEFERHAPVFTLSTRENMVADQKEKCGPGGAGSYTVIAKPSNHLCTPSCSVTIKSPATLIRKEQLQGKRFMRSNQSLDQL